jgi:hypothetical protein
MSNLQRPSPIASQPVVHPPPQHQMATDTSSDENRPLLPRTKPKNMRKQPKPTTPSQPQHLNLNPQHLLVFPTQTNLLLHNHAENQNKRSLTSRLLFNNFYNFFPCVSNIVC